LIPAVSGGRVPAVEVLLGTPAVRNLIREGKSHQIDNIIQTSGALGMVTLDVSLATWTRAGVVSADVARVYSMRPDEFDRLLTETENSS
jgi:twitching motility protein PilT